MGKFSPLSWVIKQKQISKPVWKVAMMKP